MTPMIFKECDQVLEFLAIDGMPHSEEEIAKSNNLEPDRLKMVIIVLSQLKLVKHGDEGLMIEPDVREVIPDDKKIGNVTDDTD